LRGFYAGRVTAAYESEVLRGPSCSTAYPVGFAALIAAAPRVLQETGESLRPDLLPRACKRASSHTPHGHLCDKKSDCNTKLDLKRRDWLGWKWDLNESCTEIEIPAGLESQTELDNVGLV
jgi:hypothetical protein